MLCKDKFASCGKDKIIKIWDLNSYTCTTKLEGHTRGVLCLLKLNDEEFASGSGDSTIKIWNWNYKRNVCKYTLKGHTDAVISLCI